MFIEDLRAALPLDAMFLSLHGAMVTEHLEDPKASCCSRIRRWSAAHSGSSRASTCTRTPRSACST
jgi:microcystin degradation protein MlrC